MVTTEMYRIVRNPMYLGAEVTLAGEAVFFGSGAILIFALFTLLMFHLFVIYYEEPHLKKIFGAAYEEYVQAVPRWLPRTRRITN
jgi:protein-S-isoprenylcysteine O-methyltransferase Ste14